MNIMILFDGNEYVNELLPEGVDPDTIWAKHAAHMFLDYASSQEDADLKIRRDRDRHKPYWT